MKIAIFVIKMNKITVKIPHISDVNLRSFNALQYFLTLEEIDTENVVLFLSSYLNIDREKLENTAMPDILGLYETVTKSIDKINTSEKPLKEINVNGKAYELIDFSKMPAIWYMTSQRLIAQKIQSHQVAAMCYIESGKTFQETNLNDREKEFEEYMTAAQYYPLNAFFLEKFEMYQAPFLAIQKYRMNNQTQTK